MTKQAHPLEAATARGYVGETPDPHPNSAHSIASGPDAPPAVPNATTRVAQPQSGASRPAASSGTRGGDAA